MTQELHDLMAAERHAESRATHYALLAADAADETTRQAALDLCVLMTRTARELRLLQSLQRTREV